MFFRLKPKPISFEETHRVLLVVLRDIEEDFWHDKLSSVSRESFVGLLGGMGSFNDLVICPENRHRISEHKEPLANALLSCLTSICCNAAQKGKLTPMEAVAACGTVDLALSGWRCFSCGYSQVSYYNLRAFIAAIGVRKALGKGPEHVLRLWKGDEDVKALQDLINLAAQSQIRLANDNGWMRPCPSCTREDTCVFRWLLQNGRFVPAPDNLSRRNNP